MKHGHAALAVIAAILVVSPVSACAEEGDMADSPAAEAEEATTDEATTEEAESEDDGDTGRMSDGEFQMFSDYDSKFADELEQWSGGYATCATIGQAGDLAGFRDCIDEEWEGVEDAGLLAYSNAEDTYDDVAKQCLARLRGYARQVDRVYTQNSNAYEAAKALDLEAISTVFAPLARAATRYGRASVNAHTACEPNS
jgi:hypothetical protein